MTGVQTCALPISYYLDIALFLFLSANALLSDTRNRFREEFRAHWPRAIAAGLILFLSFTTYRVGLHMAKVSYAVSVRQASAVVGVENVPVPEPSETEEIAPVMPSCVAIVTSSASVMIIL